MRKSGGKGGKWGEIVGNCGKWGKIGTNLEKYRLFIYQMEKSGKIQQGKNQLKKYLNKFSFYLCWKVGENGGKQGKILKTYSCLYISSNRQADGLSD